MRDKMKCPASAVMTLAFTVLFSAFFNPAVILAQDDQHPDFRSANRTPGCTNATATGTYGYRMTGIIVGVGVFLVNGIYTHEPDGTMNVDVQLVLGNQNFAASGTNGTFRTNSDCTGSGKFAMPTLNLEVTYNFIVTDGGEQIELLNTNPGIVLHGISRRISKHGRPPSCHNDMILGTYGYRLDGALPDFPNVAAAGVLTHKMDHAHNAVGTFMGSDTFSFMGHYASRAFQGTFKLESNCRGTASYADSLGNRINYVFTVVNDGATIFLQGADPGTAISGIAQRVR
jgi:hypothetical protein